MRYLLIILSLLSFSLCQFLPSDEDLAKMSYAEKSMIYYGEKKSPTGTILRELLIPTLGYAYIEDWKRGIYFALGEVLLLGIALDADAASQVWYERWIEKNCEWVEDNCAEKFNDYIDDKERIRDVSTFILIVGLNYKLTDLFTQTNKYNERLHNKIFSKKDKKLSYLLLPTLDGAYLNLSYKF